jgi:uncharacterized membrane protein (DUF2068 family)
MGSCPSEPGDQTQPASSGEPQVPFGVLAWIAGYKLIKSVLATIGGIVVLRLGHQNLSEVARHLLNRCHFDPDGWVGARLIAHVGHFNPKYVHIAGQLLLLYAILYLVEAVGLFLEKRWAEWLTVVQTSLLIPVEIFELMRQAGPIKILALCASLSIVAYLIWRIQRDSLQEEREATLAASVDSPPVK